MSVPDSLNPYAPPAVPVELDFREAAVAETSRLLAANPGRRPEDLPISLVVPLDEPQGARLTWIGRMTLLRLILGIGGLGLGGALGALAGKLALAAGIPREITISLAVACSLGGIMLLLCNMVFVRRAVRRAIGERFRHVQRQSILRSPLCVAVEDARTFTRIKIVPEDFAWIAFDSVNRRLILEGMIFRYFIQAADVLRADQVAGATTTGVQIVFRAGTAVIGITLQFDSVWHELKKQTIATGTDPLLKPIRETLGFE